jgi:biotin transport system substrate-specific component
VVVYAVGVPVMAARAGISLAQGLTVMWLYVPGDLIKAVVASVIVLGVHRGYPSLFQQRTRVEVDSR